MDPGKRDTDLCEAHGQRVLVAPALFAFGDEDEVATALMQPGPARSRTSPARSRRGGILPRP